MHTGVAVGTNLFFVSEDNNGGPLWVLVVDLSHHLGVSANAVVVTVSTDHASVQTNVSCFVSRNYAQLCAEEISLGDAVLFVEDLHQVQFYLLGSFVILELSGTDEDIQALAFECFAQSLLSLFGRKVWQQVGYAEDWVVLIFTDGDGNNRTVFLVNIAVQCQRNGRPLIFLDAAVVMWSEEAQFSFFKQWVWFEVQSWRIYVSSQDLYAFFDWTCTHGAEDERFTAVIVVESFARQVFSASLKFMITVCLKQLDCLFNSLDLDLCSIHELFVVLSKRIRLVDFFIRQTGGTVFLFEQQFFLEQLAFGLIHIVHPPD